MKTNGFFAFCVGLFWLATASFVGAQGLAVPGGLTRDLVLEAGGRADGQVEVRNTSKEVLTVKAYLKDYLFYADGRNDYAEPGSTPRSNAKWLKFSPERFDLQPGKAGNISFSVQVPPSGASGTYWSMLMVERLEAVAGASEPKKGLGIHAVIRYGIQISTTVNPPGAKKIRFFGRKVVLDGGKRTLLLDVENIGEQVVIPAIWAEFFDAAGVSKGRFPGGKLRLYPTCSGRYRIDLAKVPAGKYSVLVVADSGEDSVFGARYQLELP